MPLSKTSKSHIGTNYLTTDATSGGEMHTVYWSDWATRTKKVAAVAFGLSGTPYTTKVGVGAKGFVTLVIPSCTSTLFDAIKAQAATNTVYAGVFYHAQLGTMNLDVEVLDIVAPADEQWVSGDPVENVTVRLVSYGVTA